MDVNESYIYTVYDIIHTQTHNYDAIKYMML